MDKLILVTGVALLLAGCSDGNFVPRTTIPLVKSAEISSATGGSVQSVDGSLSLDFPQGAVASDMEISITQLDTSGLDPLFEEIEVDLAYEFGPAGTVFDEPAEMTVSLGSVEPGGALNLPLVVLGSGDQLEMLEVTSTTLDSLSGELMLTAEIPHFSTLAVSFDPNGNFVLASARLIDFPEEVFAWEEFNYSVELRDQAARRNGLTTIGIKDETFVESDAGNAEQTSTGVTKIGFVGKCRTDVGIEVDLAHEIVFMFEGSSVPEIDQLLARLREQQTGGSASIRGQITNSISCLAPRDVDNDGLNAHYEELAGTDPENDDSDSDGISDALEDPDGDGFTNLQEQQNGTDPREFDDCGAGTDLDCVDAGSGDDDVDSAADDLGQGDTDAESVESGPDFDLDGIVDSVDEDDDGDGVDDSDDAFPLDASETVDSDGDGIGNNADTDDDNDGVLDINDAFQLDSDESVDTDLDGIGNNADTDDDGDGIADGADAFPLDASETVDTDMDGIGNNADPDDDGDGVADGDDAFPLDASESVDTDMDGIGNNADTDDDNDGRPDAVDPEPLVFNDPVPDEPRASVVAKPGDPVIGTDAKITRSLPIGVTDDGSVLLLVQLDDDRIALVRSLASTRLLELVGVTTDAYPNQFTSFTWFSLVGVHPTIADAGLVIFQSNVDFDGVTGPGIWAWVAGQGLQPISSECLGTGVYGAQFVPEGLFANCDGKVLVGMPGAMTVRNTPLEGEFVDGYPDADPPATVSSQSFFPGPNGTLYGYQFISCEQSRRCLNGFASRVITISSAGQEQTIIDFKEQISPDSPFVYRSGASAVIDTAGRMTFFVSRLRDADSRKGAPSNSILRIGGGDNEYIINQETFDPLPAPLISGATVDLNGHALLVALNGDMFLRLQIESAEGETSHAYYTHRDGELKLLVKDGDDAPGYPGQKIANIYDLMIGSNGRVMFSANTEDFFEQGLVYIDDQCADTPFVEVPRSLFAEASPESNPFSPITPVAINGANQFVGYVAEVSFLFDMPEGKCSLDMAINSVGDAPDTNPGDFICNTGGFVSGVPECTLRAAIEEVNSSGAVASIDFAFPGRDTDILIQPRSALPIIEKRLTLAPDENTTAKIIISGSLAGDASGIHTTSGALTLKNFEIRDFAGDGIEAENNGVTNLININLVNNGGYGIHAISTLEVTGSDSTQALIANNSQAGILAESGLRLTFVDVRENFGAGVIAESSTIMVASRIIENGAEGFVSTSIGSCGRRRLSTQPPFQPGTSVATNTFSGNSGVGISVETGGVQLDPGTVVSMNAGTGVLLECGALTTGDVIVADEAPIKIIGNATASSCFRTGDAAVDHAISIYSCAGGGIELRGMTDTLLNLVDDVDVSENKGFGMLVAAPTLISSSSIRLNQGPGVWAPDTLDSTLLNVDSIVAFRGNITQVQENIGEGILFGYGNLSVRGVLDVSNNLSTGILIEEGDINMLDIFIEKSVVGNGSTSSNCHAWQYNDVTEEVSRSIQNCQQNGIVANEGSISADNLLLKDHLGTGVEVSGNARFRFGKICDNGVDFNVGGTLTLTEVDQVCP